MSSVNVHHKTDGSHQLLKHSAQSAQLRMLDNFDCQHFRREFKHNKDILYYRMPTRDVHFRIIKYSRIIPNFFFFQIQNFESLTES